MVWTAVRALPPLPPHPPGSLALFLPCPLSFPFAYFALPFLAFVLASFSVVVALCTLDLPSTSNQYAKTPALFLLEGAVGSPFLMYRGLSYVAPAERK